MTYLSPTSAHGPPASGAGEAFGGRPLAVLRNGQSRNGTLVNYEAP